MTSMAEVSARHGTRWGRAVPLVLVGFAAIAAMGTLVVQHVLATYLVINAQSTPASFNTSALIGQDVGFGMVPTSVDGASKAVLRAGFATASLDGFCLSKSETIAGVTIVLKVTAGNNAAGTAGDITANNASFDLLSFKAGGSGIVMSGMDQIGLATDDITTTRTGGAYDVNPLGGPLTGNGQGWIGIDATQGTFSQLKGKLYTAEVQGNINLPHLSITTSPGGTACDDPSAAYQN